jgi:phosphoglycerate dehydrogenase-like enzyme
MKVRFCDLEDRSQLASELNLVQTEYSLLVRECDVLSFHVPLTPLTKGMFGQSMIDLTSKRPLIINTSRGGVVDHDAVVSAVCSKVLSAYAADVFMQEPWETRTKEMHPNLYFTPHIAAHSKEAKLDMGRFCINALQELVSQGFPF